MMKKPLFWVDLEMTGLDETVDSILEIAVVITDWDFKPLEEYHRIIFQPQDVLEKMNDWCKKTHGESGLTAAVGSGIPLATVEQEILGLISRHYSAQDRIVLAGNSVDNDRRFILHHMPEFAKRLHYRLIDVTSYKEVFREKFSIAIQKESAHRAVDDIYESIRELTHYLSFVKIPESEKT